MTDQALLKAAAEARLFAYAPYSNFKVGAAILTVSGEIFTGCNVENVSYGLTSCAERNAVFSAIAVGQTKFSRIALILTGAASPCGACRQVLNEFAPDLQILTANPELQNQRNFKLTDLLPQAFGPQNLQQ